MPTPKKKEPAARPRVIRDSASHPVDAAALGRFLRETQALANRLFGLDDYRRAPRVELLALDRTRFGPLHYRPLPLSPTAAGLSRMDVAMVNLALADSEAQTLHQIEAARGKEPLRPGSAIRLHAPGVDGYTFGCLKAVRFRPLPVSAVIVIGRDTFAFHLSDGRLAPAKRRKDTPAWRIHAEDLARISPAAR